MLCLQVEEFFTQDIDSSKSLCIMHCAFAKGGRIKKGSDNSDPDFYAFATFGTWYSTFWSNLTDSGGISSSAGLSIYLVMEAKKAA